MAFIQGNQSVVSTANSTVIALNSLATLTGRGEDVHIWNSVIVAAPAFVCAIVAAAPVAPPENVCVPAVTPADFLTK